MLKEQEGEERSLDGNGEEERGGTFSSKKVDWTQEPGSPRGKRERDRENKRTNYIKLLDIQALPL